MISKNKIILKTISLIVAGVFLCQQVVWAAGGADTASVTTGKNINVSNALAHVDTSREGNGGDFIVNIQDCHSSLSTQYSIVNVLKELLKEYDLNVIAIEGGTGFTDTSVLRSLPEADVRENTAAYLMREGKISAGEFFSVTAEEDVAVYGVEDNDLYAENLKCFREIHENNAGNLLRIKNKLAGLRTDEKQVYSPELHKVLYKARLHNESKISFDIYWDFLEEACREKGISTEGYRSIAVFLEAVRLEKEIDFARATSERKQLIDGLMPVLGKGELEDMVARTLRFSNNEIAPEEYHRELIAFAAEKDVDTELYPELLKYAAYTDVYRDLNIAGLQRELDTLEKALVDSLFSSDTERYLYRSVRLIELCRGLFEIKLSSEDVRYLTEHMEELESAPDMAAIIPAVKDALKFYEVAEKRNNAMLANTVEAMRREGKHAAALISGGHHSGGLADIMRAKDLSYLVIMPRTFKEENRPYVAVLTRKTGPYRELVSSGEYDLALEALFDNSDPTAFEQMFAFSIGQMARAGVNFREMIDEWVDAYRDMQADLSTARRGAMEFTPMTPEELRSYLESISLDDATGDVIIRENTYRVTNDGVVVVGRGPAPDTEGIRADDALTLSERLNAVRVLLEAAAPRALGVLRVPFAAALVPVIGAVAGRIEDAVSTRENRRMFGESARAFKGDARGRLSGDVFSQVIADQNSEGSAPKPVYDADGNGKPYWSDDLAQDAAELGPGTGVYKVYNHGRNLERRYGPRKACELCASQRDEGDIGVIIDDVWEAKANAYPIFLEHGVILHRDHVDQSLGRGTIESVLGWLVKSPDIKFYYNGEHAGSTIPGHRHLQYFRDTEPYEEAVSVLGDKTPVEILYEQGKREYMYASGGVDVYKLEGFPSGEKPIVSFVAESGVENIDKMASELDAMISTMDGRGLDYNVLWTMSRGRVKVFVTPRSKESMVSVAEYESMDAGAKRWAAPVDRDILLTEREKGRILATIEFLGVFVAVDEEQYAGMTHDDYVYALNALAVPAGSEAAEGLVSALVKRTEKVERRDRFEEIITLASDPDPAKNEKALTLAAGIDEELARRLGSILDRLRAAASPDVLYSATLTVRALNEKFLTGEDTGLYLGLDIRDENVFLVPFRIVDRKQYPASGRETEVLYLDVVEGARQPTNSGFDIPGEKFVCVVRTNTERQTEDVMRVLSGDGTGAPEGSRYYKASPAISGLEEIAQHALRKEFQGLNRDRVREMIEFHVELHELRHNEFDNTGVEYGLRQEADGDAINEAMAELASIALGPAPLHRVLKALEFTIGPNENRPAARLILNGLAARTGFRFRADDPEEAATLVSRMMTMHPAEIKKAAREAYDALARRYLAGPIDEGAIGVAVDSFHRRSEERAIAINYAEAIGSLETLFEVISRSEGHGDAGAVARSFDGSPDDKKNILDVGSGDDHPIHDYFTGQVKEVADPRYRTEFGGVNVTSIDPSLEDDREMGFVRGNALLMAMFPDDHFDSVFCEHVFNRECFQLYRGVNEPFWREHFPGETYSEENYYRRIAAELNRVVRPGGKVYQMTGRGNNPVFNAAMAEAGFNQELANEEHGMRVFVKPAGMTTLDPEKVKEITGDKYFLEAVRYFNREILGAELTWERVIDLFAAFRGDIEDPQYTDEIRSQRLRTAREVLAADSVNIVDLANSKFDNADDVLRVAAALYDYMTSNQIFIDAQGPSGFAMESRGLPGFDRIEGLSADTYGHSASGHHRLAWFLMNYILIRNGCAPFYFKEGDKFSGEDTPSIHDKLREHLGEAAEPGPELALKYRFWGLVLGWSACYVTMGWTGAFLAFCVSVAAMFVGWYVHEKGHDLGRLIGKSDAWEIKGGPLASAMLTAFFAAPVILICQGMIPDINIFGVSLLAVSMTAFATYLVHSFADDGALFEAMERDPTLGDATGREVAGFVEYINSSLQAALTEGTSHSVTMSGLSREKLDRYPFVPLEAAVAAKAILADNFGNRIKSMIVVKGVADRDYAPEVGELMYEHAWLEIETYDGRRYYLSFVDGPYIASFPGDQIKEYTAIDDDTSEAYRVNATNPEYLGWYFSEGLDSVTFKDVTDDAEYAAYKSEVLGVREVERGRNVEKEVSPSQVRRILEHFGTYKTATQEMLPLMSDDKAFDRLLKDLGLSDSGIDMELVDPTGWSGDENEIQAVIIAMGHEDAFRRFEAQARLEKLIRSGGRDLLYALARIRVEVDGREETAVSLLVRNFAEGDILLRVDALTILSLIGSGLRGEHPLLAEIASTRIDTVFGEESAVSTLIRYMASDDHRIKLLAQDTIKTFARAENRHLRQAISDTQVMLDGNRETAVSVLRKDKGIRNQFLNVRAIETLTVLAECGIRGEDRPDDITSAMNWINLGAAAAALVGAYAIGMLHVPSLQVAAIIGAIYFTSFLVHEGAHWAETGFARFSPKRLFNRHGISIPGARGWSGISASVTLGIVSALFIPVFPEYGFAGLLINSIFAVSIKDMQNTAWQLRALVIRFFKFIGNFAARRHVPLSHWTTVHALVKEAARTDTETIHFDQTGDERIILTTRERGGSGARVHDIMTAFYQRQVENGRRATLSYKITQQKVDFTGRRTDFGVYCYRFPRRLDRSDTKLLMSLLAHEISYRGDVTVPDYTTSGTIARPREWAGDDVKGMVMDTALDGDETLIQRLEAALRRTKKFIDETVEEDRELVEPVLQEIDNIKEEYKKHVAETGEEDRDFLADGFARRFTRAKDTIQKFRESGAAENFITLMVLSMDAMVHIAYFFKDPEGYSPAELNTVKSVSENKGNRKGTPVIVFADSLGLFELPALVKKYNIQALALRYATPTSHVAIMAKNMNIPVIVVDLPEKGRDDFEGEVAMAFEDTPFVGDKAVKAIAHRAFLRSNSIGRGEIVLRPEGPTVRSFRSSMIREMALDGLARAERDQVDLFSSVPVGDTGGEVRLSANADNLKELEEARENGADGVGLLRTEFLFENENIFERDNTDIRGNRLVSEYLDAYIDGGLASSTDQRGRLREGMKEYFLEFAKKAKGRSVTARMVDFQNDKKNLIHAAAARIKRRDNVRVGRGVNFFRSELGRDILTLQVEAMLEARAEGADNLRILFPMVSNRDDVELLITSQENGVLLEAKERAARRVTEERLGAMNGIPVGVMIETVEAVDNIAYLLEEENINFYSVGTNDLASYIMGERDANGKVVKPLSRDDPKSREKLSGLQGDVLEGLERVFREIVRVNTERGDNGKKAKSLSICGEMASWYSFHVFLASFMSELGPEARTDVFPLTLSMASTRLPGVNTFMRRLKRKAYAGINFHEDGEDNLGRIPIDHTANERVIRVFERLYRFPEFIAEEERLKARLEDPRQTTMTSLRHPTEYLRTLYTLENVRRKEEQELGRKRVFSMKGFLRKAASRYRERAEKKRKDTDGTALGWINMGFALVALAIAHFTGIAEITSFQTTAAISAIYFASFLVHELFHYLDKHGHTLKTLKKFFTDKDALRFTKHGITVPDSRGVPGIAASLALGAMAALFIPFSPQYAIPALAINLIFALSIPDWFEVMTRSRGRQFRESYKQGLEFPYDAETMGDTADVLDKRQERHFVSPVPVDGPGRFAKKQIGYFLRDIINTKAYHSGKVMLNFHIDFWDSLEKDYPLHEADMYISWTEWASVLGLKPRPKVGERLSFAGTFIDPVDGTVSILGYPDGFRLPLPYDRSSSANSMPVAVIDIAKVMKPLNEEELTDWREAVLNYQTYPFGDVTVEKVQKHRHVNDFLRSETIKALHAGPESRTEQTNRALEATYSSMRELPDVLDIGLMRRRKTVVEFKDGKLQERQGDGLYVNVGAPFTGELQGNLTEVVTGLRAIEPDPSKLYSGIMHSTVAEIYPDTVMPGDLGVTDAERAAKLENAGIALSDIGGVDLVFYYDDITIDDKGNVIALGYVENDNLFNARKALYAAGVTGRVKDVVHITIARIFDEDITPEKLVEYREYIRSLRGKQDADGRPSVLGRVRGSKFTVYDQRGDTFQDKFVQHHPDFEKTPDDARAEVTQKTRIEVNSDEAYDIMMTRDVFRPENLLLSEEVNGRKAFFVVDKGIGAGRIAELKDYIRATGIAADPEKYVMVVPGGEKVKNGIRGLYYVLKTMYRAWRAGLDRKSAFVLVGGGATLDMAGLAATLFHRGAEHVRIPSTLLAQDDAGVGVKNGINFFGQKNFMGTFQPPQSVLIDPRLLSTAPRQLMSDGLAEAIKVTLMKDSEGFEYLEENYEVLLYLPEILRGEMPAALRERFAVEDATGGMTPEENALRTVERIIWTSVINHTGQISTDPMEKKLARPLDYGHQWGHRLEVVTRHRLSHGQGVAIGMAIDSYISWKRGYITGMEFDRIIKVILGVGLPVSDRAATFRNLWQGLEEFRAHLGGDLTISLLGEKDAPRGVDGIGKKQDVSEIMEDELKEAVEKVAEIAATGVSGYKPAPAIVNPDRIDFIGEQEKNRKALEVIRSIDKPTKIALVIPMYNEERRLRPWSPDNDWGEDALREKIKALQELSKINPNFDWQLIVIDDGTENAASKEQATELWREIQLEENLDKSKVKIIAISKSDKEKLRSVKGGAIHRGFREAINTDAEYIGYTDIDTSIDLRQIALLLKELYDGKTDVAIGSRWCPGGVESSMGIFEKVSSRIYNWAVRLIVWPLRGIRDTQRGFKLFNRKVLEDIRDFTTDNSLAFDTELLLLSKMAGYRVQEIAIAWYESEKARTFSMSKQAPIMVRHLFLQAWKYLKHVFFISRLDFGRRGDIAPPTFDEQWRTMSMKQKTDVLSEYAEAHAAVSTQYGEQVSYSEKVRTVYWLASIADDMGEPLAVRVHARYLYKMIRRMYGIVPQSISARTVDMGNYEEIHLSISSDSRQHVSKESQMSDCLKKLGRFLDERGINRGDVAKQNIFIRDANNTDFFDTKGRLNRQLAEFYAGNGRAPPASFIGEFPEDYNDVAMECTILVPKTDAVQVESKTLEVEHGGHMYTVDYKVVVENGIKQVHVEGLTVSEVTDNVEDQARGAFVLMKEVLDTEGMEFTDIVRQWNYVERIVDMDPYGDGERQRYRIFNGVRGEFYPEKAAWVNGYPAATGIGVGIGGVVLGCVAVKALEGRVDIVALPNPLQIDAHAYSEKAQAGKAPQFERAKAVVAGGKVRVFVSGTAGIRGEDTEHLGDVEKQTEMTIENIEALMSRENLENHGIDAGATLRDVSQFRVYVKHERDILRVRRICDEKFGDVPVQYIVADVCRPNLLMEIEAIATVDGRMMWETAERISVAVRSLGHGSVEESAVLNGMAEAAWHVPAPFQERFSRVLEDLRSLHSETEQVTLRERRLPDPEKIENWSGRLTAIVAEARELAAEPGIQGADVVSETLQQAIPVLESRLGIVSGEFPRADIDVAGLIKAKYGTHDRVEIMGEAANKTLSVSGDQVALFNTIVNLVENGLQAAANAMDGPVVWIIIEEDDGYLKISVRDNGSGLDDVSLEKGYTGRQRVFDLNNTTKIDGTGLGTTEAWYAVRDHGGDINVVSPDGEGATFVLRLPLDREGEATFVVIGVVGMSSDIVSKLDEELKDRHVRLVALDEGGEPVLEAVEEYRRRYNAYSAGVIEGVSPHEIEDAINAVVGALDEAAEKDSTGFFERPDTVSLSSDTETALIEGTMRGLMERLQSVESLGLAEVSIPELRRYEHKFSNVAKRVAVETSVKKFEAAGVRIATFRAENVAELRWLAEEHRRTRDAYEDEHGEGSYPVRLHVRLTDSNVTAENLDKMLELANIDDIITGKDITLGDGESLREIFSIVEENYAGTFRITAKDIAVGDVRELALDKEFLKEALYVRMPASEGIQSQLYAMVVTLMANRNVRPEILPEGVRVLEQPDSKMFYFIFVPAKPVNMEELRIEMHRYERVLVAA